MISTYNIRTAMGKVNQYDGHPLDFLSQKEKEEFDEIGYTGHLNGVKTNYMQYLNSLDKGEFKVVQTKFDNGDFSEEFLIIKANG